MDFTIDVMIGYGLKILIGVIIFYAGKKLARVVTNIIIKGLSKTPNFDKTLGKFLSSVIYGILLIVIALTALAQIGIQTTSFIAILGAVGLAIGLAFKDTLSNISSGIMIILFQPIKIDEFVEAGGVSGIVEEINIFHTFMKTPDNKMIILGNSSVINGNIINYSRKATRRVDMIFSISYNDNIQLAKDSILEVVNDDSRVLKEPDLPFVAVKELAESSINLVVRVWVKSEDYWNVNFDTIEKVKLRFDQVGITIPFPQVEMNTKGH
ncbi:MAG: mechanosensitive ion channel [Epsilonproteobacteria bacterium]|nr:mechanosensitive ion channel [Campylobacterota bacterium]